jgi:hypothetical protein
MSSRATICINPEKSSSKNIVSLLQFHIIMQRKYKRCQQIYKILVIRVLSSSLLNFSALLSLFWSAQQCFLYPAFSRQMYRQPGDLTLYRQSNRQASVSAIL